MAFRFTTSDGFWWPVVLNLVADGKKVTARIQVRFKRLSTDEVDAFQVGSFDPVAYAECIREADGDRQTAMILFSAKLAQSEDAKRTSADRAEELMKILCDWKDVEDEDGKPLEFSEKHLVALLQDVKSAYSDIKEAYNTAMSGEGKKGN